MLRKILAVLLALTGIVWFLQGVGIFVAVDSFMNNDLRWAVAGVLLFVGALLLWPGQSISRDT